MTHDEQCKACIEAMIDRTFVYAQDYTITRDGWRFIMTRAFDALNGLARINSVAATQEMTECLDDRWFDIRKEDILEVFDIMSAAGDLTNASETSDADDHV